MTAGADAVPLLLRAGVGTTFLFTGLEKVLGGTHRVVDDFRSLGIPSPEWLAPVVSYFELAGAVGLLVGLLVRPIAALLVVEMIVAVVLARSEAAFSARSVVDAFAAIRLEVLLAIGAACIAIVGAGGVSLEAAILRRWRGRVGGD